MGLHHLTIALLLFISLSCSDRTERRVESTVFAQDSTAFKSVDSNVEGGIGSSNKIIITSFEEDLNRMKLDTILQGDVYLSIMPTQLDTYLTQEWTQGDTLYRHNYSDVAYRLNIKKTGKTLIDTAFTKQDIIAGTDPEFENIARFFGYWLDEYINGNEMVIFGTICQPDTDWCIFFNHRIDINTGEIKFVIPDLEEEKI
ncbi:hypothetical protein ADICEAN_02560 [Cesiribacter andamanensis AMV16]|uniref:Uncharacterized protein n=1 Tax=Cesiribacter andamanensis AMV16 TaxID=1279009 RepID=M7N0V1_9BACT|nr:hypothetical protein ADICEAN_02560 [Cesiribacter andamanensis AMV16]